ncbi:hypothetical protein [Nakamurella endophytica]|uniref:Uncharacterized protein n=1 Tax=Nakamurella endophytica TaxID=1748367 RepID=A0A917TD13_9ACTN|nr:hypothetical protein [Nakamurella endophytica]GGM16122.1 hypothetical protein GCM10011594_40160 [Nakamurella endophytica]
MTTEPDDTEQQPAAAAARYTAEWQLFLDWCATIGRTPLPADLDTVHAFLVACPAQPATQRRRLTAIDHHHRAAGHPPPARGGALRDLVRGRPARPARRPLDPAAVDTALRRLPASGWTRGWFGRRDRALLVLAAADIPYRHLAQLTAADITINRGAATITTPAGDVQLAATDQAWACPACAVTAWMDLLYLEATRGTRQVAHVLHYADPLHAGIPHNCYSPRPPDWTGDAIPLLPPIDQHGWTPLDRPTGLSRQSISHLARQAAAGTHQPHRDIPPPASGQQPIEFTDEVLAPTLTYDIQQWQHGIHQRHAAREQLANIGDALDDMDTRIAELEARTKQLLEQGGRVQHT